MGFSAKKDQSSIHSSSPFQQSTPVIIDNPLSGWSSNKTAQTIKLHYPLVSQSQTLEKLARVWCLSCIEFVLHCQVGVNKCANDREVVEVALKPDFQELRHPNLLMVNYCPQKFRGLLDYR